MRSLANEAHSLVLATSPNGCCAQPDSIRLVSHLYRVAGPLNVRAVDASKERPRHRELQGLTEKRRSIDVLVAKDPRRRPTRGPTLDHEFGHLEA